MSKQQPKIRWRESDDEKLRREIKNYNARVAYAMKKNPDAILLSTSDPNDIGKNNYFIADKKNFKDVKAAIETRKDYNAVIKSLRRFTAESAKPTKTERGGRLSEYLLKEATYEQRRLRPIADAEAARIAKLQAKDRGKPLNKTLDQMGDIKQHQTRAHERNVKNLSMRELPVFLKNLDNLLNANYRKEQKEIMRENYITGLRNNGFLDDNEDLEGYIRGVDVDTFYDNAITDDTATFYFYKDPIAFEVRKTSIINTWKAAYEAYKNGTGEVVIHGANKK